MYKGIVEFIRKVHNKDGGFLPLHEPKFIGNEEQYVVETIRSSFVSSIGRYVDEFEERIREYTGAKYAIATVNGTSALHLSLILAGVEKDDLILTQPLTFVSTVNAINYTGASPVFIDIDKTSLGLSTEKLEIFLRSKTEVRSGKCYHKATNKRVKACIPMHTFGHVAMIDDIVELCNEFHITVIEDAAESMGTKFKGQHSGTFGKLGIFSFNGNKIITSGGGGMIITDDMELGKLAKHLTTQAKVPHRWDFCHDQIGYNYRLPNLNAALGCAQMEQLDKFIVAKRQLAANYSNFFANIGIKFINEPQNCHSNYWLNSVVFDDPKDQQQFLEYSNEHQVMTRPVWRLMSKLPMFENCIREEIPNAEWIEKRLVNIPSSVLL